MRAPAFWNRPQDKMLATALTPLSWAFQAGGALRRLTAVTKTAQVPLICIGNVVVGGAGKTPTAIAVAELLQRRGGRPVFITRGYGGSLQGPLRVDPAVHSAAQVGDEALLLAAVAPTWIGRDRVAAVMQAENEGTHIIMDDGLQNPHLLPDAAFLVMDSEVGTGNGRILPAGPLREPLHNALRRVRAVIAVGDKDISLPITRPVVRARIEAVLPDDFPRHLSFLAFAGIGRPEKFFATCRQLGLRLADERAYPDHYAYTDNDLRDLRARAAKHNAVLLTTAKDHVRLPPSLREVAHILPVRMAFDNESVLLGLLPD
jgi:tetraacyldisaccharide 4'-kinase